jgi:hypothetical protein
MSELIKDDTTIAGVAESTDDFSGLCRMCGGNVPPLTDPGSCTPTLCSEPCLADALVAYWAGQGFKAHVVLREGYARLEGIPGRLP